MSEYTELCRELRNTERICRDRMDGEVMLKAADAIEELVLELGKATNSCGKTSKEGEG